MKGVKNIINCDADPFIPKGWSIKEHQKGGQLEWDPSNIESYLSDAQKNGLIKGEKLHEELAGKPVLNANVLDYLLAHQFDYNVSKVKEWRTERSGEKFIFFWGTIYRNSYGKPCVRLLYYGGGDGRWLGSSRQLDSNFDGKDFAAMRASGEINKK